MNTIEDYTVRDTIIGTEAGDLEGDFYKTVRYLNYTGEVVKIRDRSGFVTHLNPCYGANYSGKDSVVVKLEMHFNHKSANDNYNRIINTTQSQRNKVDLEFLKLMTPRMRQNKRVVFTTFIVIEKATLMNNGGVNYFPTSDGTIYIGNGLEKIDNVFPPGSVEESLKLLDAFHKESPDHDFYDSCGVMYSLRVIDNTSEVPPTYYCNVLNSTVSVRAVRRAGMRDGVYLTRRGSGMNPDEHALLMEFIDIKNKLQCFIPLYDTRAEAGMNFSHPDKAYMTELAKEQHSKAMKAAHDEDLALEKLEAERARQKYEREKSEREEKLQKEKHQREEQLQREKYEREAAAFKERQEQERIKHEREEAAQRAKFEREEAAQRERSEREESAQKRKNTFDLIKYGPLIINGLITLITLAVGVFSKTPIRPIKV